MAPGDSDRPSLKPIRAFAQRLFDLPVDTEGVPEDVPSKPVSSSNSPLTAPTAGSAKQETSSEMASGSTALPCIEEDQEVLRWAYFTASFRAFALPLGLFEG